MEAEYLWKAQVKTWQGKLADVKKEMVSCTKVKDREAKELQKAKVMRAAQGEVVTQLSVECYTQPVYESLVWRQQSNWH